MLVIKLGYSDGLEIGCKIGTIIDTDEMRLVFTEGTRALMTIWIWF